MPQTLNEFAQEIVADGVVDDAEVARIRQRLYADGVIDREEADFLFNVNDAVSGNANSPSWQALFVEAIASHFLDDEASPGTVDDEEAAWLIQRIEGDGQCDAAETALLAALSRKAKSMPDRLKRLVQRAGA